MRIVYPSLHIEFELDLQKLNKIIIENKHEFRKFASETIFATEGKGDGVLFEDENRDLIKSKSVAVILSPVQNNLEGKDLIKKLTSELVDDLEESKNFEKFIEVRKKLIEIIDELQQCSEYPFDYDGDFGPTELLKILNIGFREEGDILDKFANFIKISNRLMGKKIIILVNCEAYFSEDEMAEIHKIAKYEELYIVLVESSQCKLTTDLNSIIIDNDLCVIS